MNFLKAHTDYVVVLSTPTARKNPVKNCPPLQHHLLKNLRKRKKIRKEKEKRLYSDPALAHQPH